MEWSEYWHLFLERRQICSAYKGVEIDSSYPLPLPFELLVFVPVATVDPVHGPQFLLWCWRSSVRRPCAQLLLLLWATKILLNVRPESLTLPLHSKIAQPQTVHFPIYLKALASFNMTGCMMAWWEFSCLLRRGFSFVCVFFWFVLFSMDTGDWTQVCFTTELHP